uniref:Putative secreted protein n=1 Tax=Ixodes ricinus TaxID=34613 RepID=V5GYD0_IXORI
MCRNISNMLLVLFAVVLGLTASKGEVFDFYFLKCYSAVKTGGDIFCQLYGYDECDGLTFGKCELGCGPGKNVKLPKKACPSGSMPSGCTDDVVEKFKTWSAIMRTMKGNAIKKW